ncbi:MAG: V-type ATP synthase subunit F [Desulfuromonadales bacterium]
MKEIVFLTLDDSDPGFALTGVQQQALTPQQVWSTLQKVCNDPAVGVVAADIRLLERLEQARLRALTDRWSGVLVTLPAPAGRRAPSIDELQRLVQRALGYHVRLQQ